MNTKINTTLKKEIQGKCNDKKFIYICDKLNTRKRNNTSQLDGTINYPSITIKVTVIITINKRRRQQ